MDYQEINAKTIDRWVSEGWEWGKPISHEEFVKARQGHWDVHLTPTKKVPHRWSGDLKGKQILCRRSSADAGLCCARCGLHRAGLFAETA